MRELYEDRFKDRYQEGFENQQEHLEVQTKLPPMEVIERAKEFFMGTYGLKLEEQTPESLYFTGGGGSIAIGIFPPDREGGQTRVEFVEREWRVPVRDFVAGLPR